MKIHRPLNLLPEDIDRRDFKFSKRNFKKLTKKKRSKIFGRMPKVVDHTPNMTCIKDQGKLGSCVAFTLVALKEWQECQHYLRYYNNHLNNNFLKDLSEQWVYYKCKELDNIKTQGTTIRTGLKVLKKYGVPPESYWKYDPNTKGNPKKESINFSKIVTIDNYFRLESLKQLKLALLHSPVPIGVLVFKSFYTPRNGLVKLPRKNKTEHGGHAICAVGYNDKNETIKIKNSWSTGWGHGGYGYLSYDYIKRYCLAMWAVDKAKVPIDYIKNL